MKSKAWKTMIFLTAVSLLALSVRAAAEQATPVSLLMVSDWAYQEIPEGSDSALVLESERRSQVLYESYGWSEGRLQVIWAGDLDRDGRLDLVIDYSEHEAGSAPTLFLSSQAGSGELVGEAAAFSQYCC